MKNQSGVVFEANCSKQTGQRKTKQNKQKTDGLRNVFVLTRGVTKVRVLDADLNCLVGVFQPLKEIGQILKGCARDGTEADN